MSKTINRETYRSARQAFWAASAIVGDLDVHVTIRPAGMDDLTPQGRQAECTRILRCIRSWFEYRRLPFAAVWSREARSRVVAGGKTEPFGEHLHVLLHIGDRRDELAAYLAKKLPGSQVEVTPASSVQRAFDQCDWIGDAATYVLKAVHQTVWRSDPTIPHRPSGAVYGARCGWTQNLSSRAIEANPEARQFVASMEHQRRIMADAARDRRRT